MKKAARKAEKKAQLEMRKSILLQQHLAMLNHAPSASVSESAPAQTLPLSQPSGGKAARARRALAGEAPTSLHTHRPAGGAPLASDDDPTTLALESVERRLRMSGCGLLHRVVPLTDNHGSLLSSPPPPPNPDPRHFSLSSSSLSALSRSLLPPQPLASNLTSLDLSRNELSSECEPISALYWRV